MKEKFTSLDNIKTNSLSNVDNYREHIKVPLNEINDNFIQIICEYMILLSENIYIKNLAYFKFILIRGLETIAAIFRLILFFTKNINLASYHSQKAFYVYIEFIEQISDVQNSFLQLTSRDAVLFVYKKTIFEINNEFKKKIKEENNEKPLFEKLDKYLHVNKNIICFYLQHSELKYENKSAYIRTCCDSLKRCNTIINELALYDISEKTIRCLNILLDKISINDFQNITSLLEFLELFTLKISKNIDTLSYSDIRQKLNEVQCKQDVEYLLNEFKL